MILVDTPDSLAAVRDMLAPGLCRWTPGIELTMRIDFKNDCLFVVGSTKQRTLSFAITRDDINTGRHKALFNSSVMHLIVLLDDSMMQSTARH
jgi:hypothetical protein